MARAVAADSAVMKRRGDVVVFEFSLSWLMRSLMSAQRQRLLSLQLQRLGVARLTSEYFARVIPTNKAASAPHRGLK